MAITTALVTVWQWKMPRSSWIKWPDSIVADDCPLVSARGHAPAWNSVSCRTAGGRCSSRETRPRQDQEATTTVLAPAACPAALDHRQFDSSGGRGRLASWLAERAPGIGGGSPVIVLIRLLISAVVGGGPWMISPQM